MRSPAYDVLLLTMYTLCRHLLPARVRRRHLTKLNTLRPIALGPQKYKKEQNHVGHFCGNRAMGAKKKEMVQKCFCSSVFFLWPPTKMRSFL